MPDSDFAQLAYYVVLVTDVLGQRSQLRELQDLPQSPAELQKTIETLRKTVGFLMHWREGFKNYFSSWGAIAADQYPAELKDFVTRACSSEVTYRHVSDTIIVSVCLAEDGGQNQNPPMGVFGILLAASGMHLLSLAYGQPTRSGVDVGVGVPLPPEGDIYGPALERAAYLEAKVARYPRIAVGQRLTECLAAMVIREALSPFGMIARQAAQRSQRLIFQDSDGIFALDFLGEEMYRQFIEDPQLIASIPKAYRFVKSEQLRWRGEGIDPELCDRYDTLWAYFRSRAHIWGPEIEHLVKELDHAG